MMVAPTAPGTPGTTGIAATAAVQASPVPLAAASLTREERALAAFLRDDVVAAFARAARDDERRVDVYLKLNQVIRLDDTPGSVRVQQHYLSRMLAAIHEDLQRTTTHDVLQFALRSLSFFLHHPTLAAAMPDAQVEAFLSDITSRLASTRDEATYKSCLWCLTKQNVNLARLDFLPRIVEALVLAIINPFDSRAIAVQAIKGVHLMICKFKPLMVAHGATLRIWFRPLVSRLSSSDKRTRDHTALALLEAAQFPQLHEWPSDVEDEVASALMEYALPAMQAHVTRERDHDALTVWKITLLLMRRKLAQDVVLLNDLLSVADPWLRHTDPTVRLQTLEAWRHVLGVFRVKKDWVFDKHVVVLLLQPILTCVESEAAFNVVHAAIATWRVIVMAAVQDFNAFCEAQGRSVDAIQQSAKKIKWKRWLEEVVRKVVQATIDQEKSPPDGRDGAAAASSHAAAHDVIQTTMREMFSAVVVAPNDSELTFPSTHPGSSVGSSTTVASSISDHQQSRERFEPGMDLSERDEQLLDEELSHYSASASSSSLRDGAHAIEPACPPLSGCLLASAIVLPELLKIVEKLGQAAAETTGSGASRAQRYQQLGLSIWDGFCTRLAKSSTEDPANAGADKMRLRLVRFCLDFTFGLSVSSSAPSSSADSQASTLMPSLQTDSVMTAADLISGSRPLAPSTHTFRWQLRLLHQVITLASSNDELRGLFQHPKSRIAQHLLNRVDRIVELHDVYKTWLAQWDQAAATDRQGSRAGSVRIDFSAKPATMLCVMLYLLLNLALAFDAEDARVGSPSNAILWEVVGVYSDVIGAIDKCVDVRTQPTDTVIKFRDVMINSANAAKAILERETQSDAMTDGGVGRLLRVSSRLASRSEDTEDNAAMLLQLQRSPVKEASPPRCATPVASAPSSRTIASARESVEDANSAVSTASDGVTSPCLLQAQRNARLLTPAKKPVSADDPSSPPARSALPSRDPAALPPTPRTPVRPKKSVLKATSTPLSTANMASPRSASSATIESSQTGPIFPELVGCTESIKEAYPHLPFSFRQVAPFHKIETVGHLATMTAEQIKKIGITGGVVAARKALIEFQARRARARLPVGINSPFHQRLQPPLVRQTTPLPSPSPKRILKRPTDSPSRLPTTPLPFESPQQRKRARRSLTELSSDGDDTGASHGTRDASGSTTPSEQRVTFRLDSASGESRITRPGSDSQDVQDPKEEKESPYEKMQTLFVKLDQHLQRSLHYAKKIVEEEEHLHSLSASLGDEGRTMATMVGAIQHSTGLVTDINSQLVVCATRDHERHGKARVKGDATTEHPSR